MQQNQKQRYNVPELSVLRFDPEDVLTASGDGRLAWGSSWGSEGFEQSRDNTFIGGTD